MWGPTQNLAKRGFNGFVLLTEVKSWLRTISLMKGKKLAFDHYKGFEMWLINQHDVKVKKFHTD